MSHEHIGIVNGAQHGLAATVIGLLHPGDAAYSYLAEDAPPPLAALAPETTVYVSGLSKNVATGLRIGFVAAPESAVPALERAIRATTWNTPALTAAIACRWLEDAAEPFATATPAPRALRLALGSADLHDLRATLGRVRQVVEEDGYR